MFFASIFLNSKILAYFIVISFGILTFNYTQASELVIEQQGFESFKVQSGIVHFNCTAQCVYVLGAYNREYDYISVKTSGTGEGKLGYGFLNDKQIVPGEIIPFKSGEYKLSFSSLPFVSQLTDGLPVLIVIEGTVSGEIETKFEINTFSENISNGWSDFFTFDLFRPYTINLLYGPKIGGENINSYFYTIFFIVGLLIFLMYFFDLNTKKLLTRFFIVGIILWFIYDLRMTAEFIKYTLDNKVTWIDAPIEEKNYKQIYKNLPLFEKFVDATLTPLHKKEFMFYSEQDWPYRMHMKYAIYPKKITDNDQVSDILVIWDSPVQISEIKTVSYGKEENFTFNKVIKNNLFPNSYIFLK